MEARPVDIAALLTELRAGRLTAAAVGALLAEYPELRARVEAALLEQAGRSPDTASGDLHNHGPSQQGDGNTMTVQTAAGGMIFNAPVTVSGGHLGPVWRVTVENLILGLAPRIHKKIVLIYAPTQRDLPLVEREVQRLRQDGYDVNLDLASRAGDALSDADKASLAEAEQVHVFWSVEARRDARVAAEIALVRQLDREHAQGLATGLLLDGTRPSLTGRFVTTRLDGAVLPAELALDPELPSWGVLLGVGGTVAALAWARQEGMPLGRGQLIAGAIGVALLLLAAAQWRRRGDRVLKAATVHGWGLWLDRATPRQILELSDQILNRVFGAKILSWRSVGISAALSLLTVVPLAVIFGGWAASGQTDATRGAIGIAVGVLMSLVVTLPLALGNVVMDFLALGLGRALLRRLVQGGDRGARLALGLLSEGLLVVGTGAAVLCSNLAGLLLVGVAGGSIWAWPLAVGQTSLLALNGEIAWQNLHRGWITPVFLLTAFAVLTGAFPALVHGSLLLLAGLNRLLGHRLLPLGGETLQRAADTPHGPWTVAAPLTALLAAGLLVWRAPDVPTEPLQEETLQPIPLVALCAQGCTFGSPDGEPGQDSDEVQRTVSFGMDILMMRAELTQARWARVWQAAEGQVPDRFGLPEAPSVFVGDPLPVEGVSWCEAARFANLRTLVELEGVVPAYTVATTAAGDSRYALDGCEEGAEIRWDRDSTAWRLPTEAEWEVAARGGDVSSRWWTGDEQQALLAAEWLAPNAGWHTHGTCTALGAGAHPLGLCDMLGNVQEWTWDLYVEAPPGGLDPAMSAVPAGTASRRVIRGGSWGVTPAVARAADRDWFDPWRRDGSRGFRLVRSVGPPPSGSGS